MNILSLDVRRSGHDFTATAMDAWNTVLNEAGVEPGSVVSTFSTGYGRRNVPYARENKTEISCHAKGCYHYFPQAITIVDIGGQDNKIIKLDERGMRLGFKMNRKCAAGTGAFLEEMAYRLDLPIGDLDGYARRATHEVTLGSYCTVFSATEVLEKIRAGTHVADIVKGLFRSVAKRVLEMDTLTEHVVLTGGVAAYNPVLQEILEEEIGREVLVPPHPQFTGAIGAALFALESHAKK
jgi:predicted CoA-substrate-specific enzyme activase